MATMTPVNVVMKIPAKFEAQFWIPPMEATWALVGATSPGRDQMLAPANAKDA